MLFGESKINRKSPKLTKLPLLGTIYHEFLVQIKPYDKLPDKLAKYIRIYVRTYIHIYAHVQTRAYEEANGFKQRIQFAWISLALASHNWLQCSRSEISLLLRIEFPEDTVSVREDGTLPVCTEPEWCKTVAWG